MPYHTLVCSPKLRGYAVQLRDKMRRQADEEAQSKAELAAAERVREERDAVKKAREAAAAAAARALSEEIRKYNECGSPSPHRYLPLRLSSRSHPPSSIYPAPPTALPSAVWCH